MDLGLDSPAQADGRAKRKNMWNDLSLRLLTCVFTGRGVEIKSNHRLSLLVILRQYIRGICMVVYTPSVLK